MPTLLITGRGVLAMFAFGLVSIIARAIWNTGPTLRLRSAEDRWARRWFGGPRPQPVEMGSDGRWQRYVDLKTKRAERRAGIAMIVIAGGVLAFGLLAAALIHP